jgi:putative MATE family efflux protein
MSDAQPPASALVHSSVGRTLLRMALPMLAGTFAMNAYNLTDTWYVSRLGTVPLAAMGFTFPVVMLLTCLAGGLGTGITTLASHAIGRRAHGEAARFVTHGLLLVLAVTAVLAVLGYLSIDFVFSRLGADAEIRPLIGDYMRTWYAGAFFMSLPMTGNGILISSGDSKAAAWFMMGGTLLNAVLDPIMIFGWLGFPAMGLRGAALATVIAQGISAAWLFRLLLVRHRLILLDRRAFAGFGASFRRIMAMGGPSILSMILMPVSAAVLTRFIGRFGHEAVAACGAASRLEMFAFVIPMALGISLTPFISQNFGAGRPDRVREAFTIATRFALLYGGAVALVFFLFAPGLASLFSRDPAVVSIMISYIRIIAFGYGMMEAHRYCGFIFTGMHRPIFTTAITAARVLALLIPLAWLGMRLGGVTGLFWGRLATDLIAGTTALVWARRYIGSIANS